MKNHSSRTSCWLINQYGKDEQRIVSFSAQINQAREVARRTREFLAAMQGWCLWKCSTLGGEVIAVIRDASVTGYPDGYPAYTEIELRELFKDDVSEATLRLVHEAKKLVGAKVTNNEGGIL